MTEGNLPHFGLGWVRLTPLDSCGRRALWMRIWMNGSVEFRAGREGGDAYCILKAGSKDFKKMLDDLREVLETAEFGVVDDYASRG